MTIDFNEDRFLDFRGMYSSKGSTLDAFVGQTEAVTLLKAACKAAKARKEPLDHILLTGKTGLGKTMLASAIANEVGGNVTWISPDALSASRDLVSILTNKNDGDVVVFDDIHRMKPRDQDMLLPVLQERSIDIVLGKESFANHLHLDLPGFTVIGATNKDECLSGMLKDSFEIQIRLRDYTAEELAVIAEQYAPKLGIQIDKESAWKIGTVSGGVPRETIRILKRIRDFATVQQKEIVTAEMTEKVLNLLGKT